MPRSKIFEIVIVAAVVVVLTVIWAINGYEDTWFYVGIGLVAIPSSWFLFGRKGDEK